MSDSHLCPAIEVHELNFAYADQAVLEDIIWSVPQGVCAALIGPNGSGKSTLLKCLNRIVRPAGADIRVMNRPLTSYSQKELAQIIAYVAQTPEILFAYSVEEFVGMGRYPYLDPGRSLTRHDQDIVEQMMTFLGVEHLARRSLHQLSGGERQKVMLAAALAQEPRILLLDEPTSHLDPRYHVVIQQLIQRVAKEQDITVIQVTHDVSHLYHWCDHITALQSGRIAWTGPLRSQLTQERLETLFETPFVFLSEPASGKTIIYQQIPYDTRA